MNLNESIVEEAAVLSWFVELGYAIGHGQYLSGETISTPDGVFGPPPRISVPSSPNLGEKRDADGCLIAGQLTLPLSGVLSVAAASCKDYLQAQPEAR